MKDTISVMVADDHPIFRLGLRGLLMGSGWLNLVSEAGSGADAVAKARQFHPDVILMDIVMPGMDGIEATRVITREASGIAVIAMSAVDDEDRIFQALDAGAVGYIVKDNDATTVVAAVRTASEGNAYLPPAVAKRVIDRVANPRAYHRPESGPLSGKERSLLQLLAEGKRYRNIGHQLGMTERQVAGCLAHLCARLGFQNRAQAIEYAVLRGIIQV